MILDNQHLIRDHLQADPECLFMNKVCVLAPVQMGDVGTSPQLGSSSLFSWIVSIDFELWGIRVLSI